MFKTMTPWTEEQVSMLEVHQDNPKKHPYKCPKCESKLIPYVDGLKCEDCGKFEQDWCHSDYVAPRPEMRG